jgi:hypothetical protein
VGILAGNPAESGVRSVSVPWFNIHFFLTIKKTFPSFLVVKKEVLGYLCTLVEQVNMVSG